jgi:hypothetical protein
MTMWYTINDIFNEKNQHVEVLQRPLRIHAEGSLPYRSQYDHNQVMNMDKPVTCVLSIYTFSLRL